MTMRVRKLIAPAVAAAMLVTGSAVAGGDTTARDAAKQKPTANLVETAVAAGKFETLTKLVTDAGLADTLANDGPYTVFAPTDKAFSKVPAETLEALAADRDLLRQVLLYHVVDGRYPAAKLVRRDSVKTLAGPRLDVDVRKRKGIVKVGGARVITPDVRASNGVIHVINRVLIPPS